MDLTETEETAEVLASHPGIVLISKNPMTWKGFLVIDTNLGILVDVKLTVSDYPDLTTSDIHFGQSIWFLRSDEFTDQVAALLQSATTVTSLFLQLKRIVTQGIKEKFGHTARNMNNTAENFVEELQEAMKTESSVQISVSNGLKEVKLTYDDVSVTLSKENTKGWKVINSDLPDIPGEEPFDPSLGNLSTAIRKFQSCVDTLDAAWKVLNDIDNSCLVLDPKNPRPCHLYRRISLTPSLSALITIDHTNVEGFPNIELLGSTSEVAKYNNIMNSNVLKWDAESSIIDNLRILMALDDLPQAMDVEEDSEDENLMVKDEECSICFSEKLGDGASAEFPVEICNNNKCRKHFHTDCLRKWLQQIASNQVSFDRINGTCPNCKESISCNVSSH